MPKSNAQAPDKNELGALEPSNLDALALSLAPAQVEALAAFASLVRRWNPVYGLVSKGDLARFEDRHLLDGLVAVKVLQQGAWLHDGLRLFDLGSGAGLPGVPLAVALPQVSVILVDRSAKKTRFLRRVQRELGLDNLKVLCADLADLPAHCCHLATARALMPPAALWRWARPMLKPDGRLLTFDRVERSARPATGSEFAPGDFPGGSIIARRWLWMPRLSAWNGLLVVGKDDSDHSGGEPEGWCWEDDHQRQPLRLAEPFRPQGAIDRP